MERSSRFPVLHKQLSVDIKGIKTMIVICSYEDHILVMASQIGSMGTILHARKEEGVSTNPTFSVSVILGKRDEPMLVASGRQLIEHIRKLNALASAICHSSSQLIFLKYASDEFCYLAHAPFDIFEGYG